MLVADTLTADLTFYANGEVTGEWDSLRSLRGVSGATSPATRSRGASLLLFSSLERGRHEGLNVKKKKKRRRPPGRHPRGASPRSTSPTPCCGQRGRRGRARSARAGHAGQQAGGSGGGRRGRDVPVSRRRRLGKIGLPLLAYAALRGRRRRRHRRGRRQQVNAAQGRSQQANWSERCARPSPPGRLVVYDDRHGGSPVAGGADLILVVPPLIVDAQARPDWRAVDACLGDVGSGLRRGHAGAGPPRAPAGCRRRRCRDHPARRQHPRPRRRAAGLHEPPGGGHRLPRRPQRCLLRPDLPRPRDLPRSSSAAWTASARHGQPSATGAC